MIEVFALIALFSLLGACIWRFKNKYVPNKIRVGEDFCIHSVKKYLKATGLPDGVEKMIAVEQFREDAQKIVEEAESRRIDSKIIRLFKRA